MLISKQMTDDLRANERVNRTERGLARAAEQVFRTCGLMPSGPVAESELRFVSEISTESKNSRCDWVRWVRKAMGLRHYLEANMEFRHSAFLCAVSVVRPFGVKEGMEGEHPPETDLTRCHQDLEEGERF